MTISLAWLRDYLDLPDDANDVADVLTSLGLEVEGQHEWEQVPGSLEGVVVGRVLTCVKHPGADRLRLTTVDLGGEEPVQIVCGAPNVAAGQTVPVATVGTTLHPVGSDEPLKIKKGKIRGEVSMGMICAEDELGIGRSHDGILVFGEAYAPGTPAAQVIDLGRDTTLEIGLTPNRSDATSHRGVAADLWAYLHVHEGYNRPLRRRPAPQVDSAAGPSPQATSAADLPVKVLAPELAPRYAGAVLTGITVGPSPAWLRHRLEAIGVRSINNVVDATNYILHDLGQPLHAFDLERLAAPGITVRTLPQNTPFTTLDGVERELDEADLVICDADANPLCLAGVFGGQSSGVTEATTRIFLEAAVFDPVSTRRTATRHKLATDAARTFEKGVDPAGVTEALAAAVALLGEVAGARQVGPTVDVLAAPIQRARVEVSLPRLRTLSGVGATEAEVVTVLEALDFTVAGRDAAAELLAVDVPTNRQDVTREADVVEEFLRVYGYDRVPLPARIRLSPAVQAYPSAHQLRRRAADYLIGRGLDEAMGLSLVPSKIYGALRPDLVDRLVRIHNTSTVELDALRVDLVPTGLQAVTYNQNRQRLDLRFFEFGKGYLRAGAPVEEGAAVAKTGNGARDDSPPTDRANGGANGLTAGAPPAPTEYEQLAIWATGARAPEHYATDGSRRAGYAYVRGLAEGVLAAIGLPADGETPVDVAAADGSPFAYAQALRIGERTVATVGRIAPAYVRYFDCKTDEVYLALLDWEAIGKFSRKRLQGRQGGGRTAPELSRFPQVRRDLALLVDEGVTFGRIVELTRRPATRICKAIELFDVFEDAGKLGPGKRSYAVRYVFERTDRTLNDKEVDKAMAGVQRALEAEGVEVRR